jgi:hypothetical protein
MTPDWAQPATGPIDEGLGSPAFGAASLSARRNVHKWITAMAAQKIELVDADRAAAYLFQGCFYSRDRRGLLLPELQ